MGKQIRSIKLLRQGFSCHYCAEPLTFRNSTSDHIRPQSKGGVAHYDNIVASCTRCNRWKADMDYNLFLYLIKVYVKGHSREKRDGYSWACFISTQLARPLSKRARKIQRKMRKTHPAFRGFKPA